MRELLKGHNSCVSCMDRDLREPVVVVLRNVERVAVIRDVTGRRLDMPNSRVGESLEGIAVGVAPLQVSQAVERELICKIISALFILVRTTACVIDTLGWTCEVRCALHLHAVVATVVIIDGNIDEVVCWNPHLRNRCNASGDT